MAEVQIKAVSVKHDAIMDFMLSNPALALSQVALEFGIGQAWLSVIIHSDAFQAQLAEKKDGLFTTTVIPLREKLIGVAHLGVDKLGEVLENSSSVSDKQFIVDTTDSILKNLGYSPKSTPVVSATQNNTFVMQADKQMLETARANMRMVTAVRQEKEIECREDTASEEV